MEKNYKKSNYPILFYSLIGAGVAGAIGGLYYLYTLLKGEPDLTEDQVLQIEEIKNEIEITKGELTPNLAVQIMAMTNKVSEDMLKKLNPDIHEKRRKAMNNPMEYEKICAEFLEAKNYAYMSANQNVMNKFGFSDEEFQRVLHKVNPMEFEQKVFQYEKPDFDIEIPEKEVIKEAYKFYSQKFISDMRNLRSMVSQYQDPQQQELAFMRLLILKIRVDDELFIKYNLTEHQVRYLLYEYNLLEDPEIRSIQQRLSRFEEMMGTG